MSGLTMIVGAARPCTLLRNGQAVEIVGIHPSGYRPWLVQHAHLHTQASRQRSVGELAVG